MSFGSVEWSVMEANRQRAGRTTTLKHPCKCGTNEWRVLNGIDEQYRSQYNPGEYVEFTCTNCGYYFQEQC